MSTSTDPLTLDLLERALNRVDEFRCVAPWALTWDPRAHPDWRPPRRHAHGCVQAHGPLLEIPADALHLWRLPVCRVCLRNAEGCSDDGGSGN